MDVRSLTDPVVAEATGRTHRHDEALPGGGPAGNARLTAWVGLVQLVLFAAEMVTLLDVRGLVSWHVAIGIALIPPALVKTGTTGWRIVRYYTGNRPYRRAGPPPMLLRVLGPLVVLTTLAVLATGVLLIAIGSSAGRQSLVTVAGHTLDMTSLHKAAFILWAGATGLHVLARLFPALQLTIARLSSPRPASAVPGRYRRGGVIAVTLVAAVIAGVVTVAAVDLSAWHARVVRDRPARFSQR
jgi:hypothetical protein